MKLEGARVVLAGSASSVGRGREPEEAPVYTIPCSDLQSAARATRLTPTQLISFPAVLKQD